MNIEFVESTSKQYRLERKYSNLVGKKLLAKVVKTLWYEVLFQFGLTKSVVERMITKWLLGGEVDLIFSIRSLREEIKSKFVLHWEYKLLAEIYNIYIQYFYSKPVLMLGAFNKSTIPKWFKYQLTYEEYMFSKKERIVLDRTIIFDPLVFFIVTLQELKDKLEKDQMIEILKTDFSRLPKCVTRFDNYFWEIFSACDIDSKKSNSIKIAKDVIAYDMITILYNKIRQAFNKQSIYNIKEYCKQKSGKIKLVSNNMTFVNFATHNILNDNKIIPNIFLKVLNTRANVSQKKFFK